MVVSIRIILLPWQRSGSGGGSGHSQLNCRSSVKWTSSMSQQVTDYTQWGCCHLSFLQPEKDKKLAPMNFHVPLQHQGWPNWCQTSPTVRRHPVTCAVLELSSQCQACSCSTWPS